MIPSETNLPFGLKEGELIHISDLKKEERGLKCNCICPHCHSPLIAKMGNNKKHHFAHYQTKECNYALETALHLFAKKTLEEHKKIKLPEVISMKFSKNRKKLRISEEKTINFDKVYLENKVEDIVPDIVLMSKSKPLIVEIAVTHFCNDEKIDKIKKMGISAIEIDLSIENIDFYNFDKEKVKNLILNDTTGKHWLYNKKLEKKEKEYEKDLASEKERAEKKKLVEKEWLREKREKASLKMHILTSKDFQANIKKKWADEITYNPLWKSISTYLGITLETIPYYLNQEIEGEFVFNCDRRIWQSKLFASWIYKRLANNNNSSTFSIQHVVGWLKKKPYPLPLNWDLLFRKDCYDNIIHPTLADVVCDFFASLVDIGYVELTSLTKVDMSPNNKYYWFFDRLRDDLIVLPPEFNGKRYEFKTPAPPLNYNEVKQPTLPLGISTSYYQELVTLALAGNEQAKKKLIDLCNKKPGRNL